MLIPIAIIAGVILLSVIIFFATYTVVDPNVAHIVVVMSGGRKVYSPHVDADGKKTGTAYFFIPFLMRRTILPLANVKMDIEAFELKDKDVAPFKCEVTTWFRIKHPDIAVEKLDIHGDGGFEDAVRGTLEEQVRGVARAAAMKQEILDIMRDRKTFGQGVEEEVNGALDEWGLELVKLEIVDFTDVGESQVIKNYERMREADIESDSRQKVAERNKEAEVKEAEMSRESGVAKAKAEAIVGQAEAKKKEEVEIANQNAEASIAKQSELANKQKVEAARTLDVGRADVVKQATITTAEGEAQATLKKGQAEADVVQAKGTAEAEVVKKTGLSEAEVIKQKGLSEAEAKDKMAEALKKFNEAGITLEQLRAFVEIQVSKYQNLGEALKSANVNANMVTGEASNLFGFDIGPESGASFAQFIKAFESTTGKSVKEVAANVIDAVKNGKSKTNNK